MRVYAGANCSRQAHSECGEASDCQRAGQAPETKFVISNRFIVSGGWISGTIPAHIAGDRHGPWG
eukprot:3682778-Amphidinium_carterae.3